MTDSGQSVGTASDAGNQVVDAGAVAVVQRLREAGHQALLAGGCVRDMLLGRSPSDWDIATDAAPDRVAELFDRTVPVGERFGIVQVLLDDGVYEVARFRSEGPYTDGRHPDHVEPSDAQHDAQRRDFTINGMFYDPARRVIVDYVGGQRDLDSGVLRAIGDPIARFNEDGLRTLRAIRFAARLGFAIEPDTWSALLECAEMIDRVSAERIRDELTKIWTEGGAAVGLELLFECGLLQRVLPEVAAMKGVPQPPEHHPEGDVFTHVRLMMELVDDLEEPSPTLAWGVLLHDIGKPPTFTPAEQTGDRIRFHGHDDIGAGMAEAIAGRLRFARRDRERVRDLTAQHMKFRNVQQMRTSTLTRFLRQALFAELLELHRIDCSSSHGKLGHYEFCRQTLDEMAREAPRMHPQPLLTGADLLAAGYAAGPSMGQILRWLEDEQLEGRIDSKESAMDTVRDRWPLPGD